MSGQEYNRHENQLQQQQQQQQQQQSAANAEQLFQQQVKLNEENNRLLQRQCEQLSKIKVYMKRQNTFMGFSLWSMVGLGGGILLGILLQRNFKLFSAK